MLVVDASVAVKWFLVEPGDREALALLESDHPLIAPELVVAEVVNAVWKRLVSGGIDHAQAADVPPAILKLFTELWPIVSLAARALDIAGTLRHPAYDCFYLALAEERGQAGDCGPAADRPIGRHAVAGRHCQPVELRFEQLAERRAEQAIAPRNSSRIIPLTCRN